MTQQAYCVKCRQKREMKDAETVTSKGKKKTLGKCGVCGTKMCRFGG